MPGYRTQYYFITGCSWTVSFSVRNDHYNLQLALRAGNEKEEGETADTVGCCSLRVEHINLYTKLDDQEYVVEFDFLGKDSIRYYNKIPVEKRVRVGELLFSAHCVDFHGWECECVKVM